MLGRVAAHGARGARPARDSLDHAVGVAGAAPLLVRQHVDAQLLFAPLDQAHVGFHARLAEVARELRGDEARRVQSRERDELQDKARRRQVPDEVLQRRFF